MKKKITAFISMILLLISAFFVNMPQAYADEHCDWFCTTWNKIQSIANDVDDTWYWARDTATGMSNLTRLVSSEDVLNNGKDIFLAFRDNPPDCAFLFEEITSINPGFDPQNPSTDDFFTIKLLTGLPFEYAKDAFPDDTFSTPARIPALLPYYTYKWCVAHVERDMINADTSVRDGYHQDILDTVESSSSMLSDKLDNLNNKLTTMNEHLLSIEGRLSAIENRLSNVENQLTTPSGKRDGWNK